jgi:hypothetical protein
MVVLIHCVYMSLEFGRATASFLGRLLRIGLLKLKRLKLQRENA